MKVFLAAIVAILLVGASLQVTSQQIIQAVNQARANPASWATKIQTKFVSAGRKGPSSDPNCYADAVTRLKSQAALAPLKESAVGDLAAALHTEYLVKNNLFSHTGEGGSTPDKRIDAAGTRAAGAWSYNENIAWMSANPTAEAFIEMWLTDCGVLSRGHYNNIYSTRVTHYGCYEMSGKTTCVGLTSYSIKPEQTSQLSRFGLSLAQNDAGYTGL